MVARRALRQMTILVRRAFMAYVDTVAAAIVVPSGRLAL